MAWGERTRDDMWNDPVEVIPMKAGYDWRKYAEHAPHFLCKDGRPIEFQGPLGNWWRPCTFDNADDELRAFVKAMLD